MKPFWDNLFYDMEECGDTKEMFALKGGADIRDELSNIEDAIRKYDGKAALDIIEKLKSYY